MNSLFEIATHISTPLMLGGFAAAAFFLIVRLILQSNLVGKAPGSTVVLIVNRLFQLAVLGMVLGFVAYIVSPASARSSAMGAEERTIMNSEVRPENLPDFFRAQRADVSNASQTGSATRPALILDGSRISLAPIGAGRSFTLSASKLTLRNGARIITNGNVLRLEVSMIAADSGEIVSFPELQTPASAPPGVQGTSGGGGGEIQIVGTTDVLGTLTVTLPGQPGGKGGDGTTGDPGANGTHRGADAVDGVVDCSQGGGNGEDGGPGSKGKAGMVGGRGGDGGNLVLIGSAQRLRSVIRFVAPGGSAGEPGGGGPGGPGGHGADGGSGKGKCGGGRAGNTGASGRVGDVGPPASGGNDGRIILR